MVEAVIQKVESKKLFFYLEKNNELAKSFKFICIKNNHCLNFHVLDIHFCIFLELYEM